MPFASIGGTKARYEVRGDGPPPLMLAPAAFDASMSRWRLNVQPSGNLYTNSILRTAE